MSNPINHLFLKSAPSDPHGSQALEALRASARTQLKEQSLPQFRDESYQRFNITKVLTEAAEHVDTPRLHPDVQVEGNSCFLDRTSEIIRATFLEDSVSVDTHSDGYFIGELRQFEQHYPGVAQRYLGTMDSVQADPLSALNTLYAHDVLVLYLPKGQHLDQPVHILQRAALRADSIRFYCPRILVIAEEDSSAKILICDHADHEETPYYRNSLLEIYAERGSHIQCYDIEETPSTATRIHSVHIHQAEDSMVLTNNLTITNGRTRNNYFCELAGTHSELNLDGLAILDSDQQADTFSLIRHMAPDCHSDELFKYTVNDRAQGAFSGMIYVDQVAQKTLAYQNNRNLLLSDKARMYSKPQLEIYADDVRCTHGLTTGELDARALFYMQQRGIPFVEARLMLIIAFMNDVLTKIDLPDLRERLGEIIERRYRGIPATCAR